MSLDSKRYPILIVDDEQDNLDAFRFNFRKTFDILTATNGPEALAVLAERDVAVVVTDQRMPKMTGIELLREIRQRHPETVGIILTAFTDVDVLVEAINLGQIYRYITKPWDAKEVRGVLQYAMERYHLTLENRRLTAQLAEYTGYLNQELHGKFDFGNIIGESSALGEVLSKVEQVAPTASTVLLRGETGTGKELVAHAIHINSPREHKPFVRVNCAALAPGVLESELFGHEKGSFTGAAAAPRALRAGGRRHAVPRRGGRPAHGGADQAPAHLARARVRARRRQRDHQGGRPPGLGDQPQPRADDRGQRVPRGPLLPAQRGPHPPAAAARPAR
ncbi:MAG: sigma-54-dependent Fis family transcriptional regulator [Myxococcales bacterium]|nr:sigma-54-dependent Fis family transcriptional regulator [Myxococcales bacterium]